MAGFSKMQLPTLHVCVCKALSNVFGDRIISSGFLPSRSCDLNHCDFFFFCCLKDKVYNGNSRTKEVKENVRREIANIPAERLQNVN
jgi:hypothetical protein